MVQEIVFENLLKSYRHKLGWSQKDAAVALDIQERTYQNWESGKNIPASKKINLIINRFKLNEFEADALLAAAVHAPSELSTIPFPPNILFTGRKHLLQSLTNLTPTTTKVALSGLPGVGKTQLAVEYAHHCFPKVYRAVLWVKASSYKLLVADFAIIAKRLDLLEKDENLPEEIINVVIRWLEMHTRWLLVFDNVDDFNLVQQFIPSIIRGRILFTTRSQIIGNFAQKIEVPPMERNEGMLFLLRRAKLLDLNSTLENVDDADFTSAKQIVDDLEGLPLALDQAGAYIEETAYTLPEYITLFQQQRLDFLQDRRSSYKEHPASVVITFRLCFERVRKQNVLAVDLIKLCAFLHADAIPEEIITTGAVDLDEPFSVLATDPVQRGNSIAALLSYSLIRRYQDQSSKVKMFSIHRLVQTILKDTMDEQTKKNWIKRTVHLVSNTLPSAEFETTTQYRNLLPHALKCTMYIDQWNIVSFDAARLLNRVGHYLTNNGFYEDVEVLLKRSLEIYEKVLGSEHPDVAETLNTLGFFYNRQGVYEPVELLYLRALTIREKTLGMEHPDTAFNLNTLAFHYISQGRYDKAEPLIQRALDIQKKVLGFKNKSTISSLNTLALLYINQGKYEQAKPLVQLSVEVCQEILGEEHPETMRSIATLIVVYYHQREFELAENLSLKLVSLNEKVYGPEHPDTTNNLNNLAALYNGQGKYEQAEPFYQRALDIRRKKLGIEHPDTAQSLNNLGVHYTYRGMYEQAEVLHMQALEIRKKVLGHDHPDTASSFYNLAKIYDSQEKYEQAISLYQKALLIYEKRLGVEHPITLKVQDAYTKIKHKETNTDS